mmetsp:Transcript_80152/g.158777  ORF Transcript_80152/g.158777 Transcript_80152/m.158777 type:complete len:244 (+) Transcript_80152:669-1400(+)
MAPWIDRGSKAGSRVPLATTDNADWNSSQPAHSTRPAPLASSESVNIPLGASVTTCHTACATSKSWPLSPTARPRKGSGKNLAPASPSMMPRPAAASLPAGAPSRNLSSAVRKTSGESVAAGCGAAPPLVDDQFLLPSPGRTAASSPPAGPAFVSARCCSAMGGGEAITPASLFELAVGRSPGGGFTESHCVIISRTFGANTTPCSSAIRTPSSTSSGLPASMPALICKRGDCCCGVCCVGCT